MIGISSRSAGVLLLPNPGTEEYAVLDVVGGQEKDPVEAQYLYSAAQDWEEIEDFDRDALLKTVMREYWVARTVSLLRLAIGGLERPLEKRVLEHVEETFATHGSSEIALDRLLVAPLKDPCSPRSPADSALTYGFSVVASVLDELAELQPLLHRFADIWLSLEEKLFIHFPERKETIWTTVVEKSSMKGLLKAASRRDFIDKWNLLAFDFQKPQSRSEVIRLGKELSARLFPEREEEEITGDSQAPVNESKPHHQAARGKNDYAVYTSVKKQIAAIARAVSQGHDEKAGKFLRELVDQQTSFPGGETHAVKSLCNIAQQCADMFRTDFEVICLDKARKLSPCDAWALIQYGDHLKRVGDYDEAVRVFGQAEHFGESVVARSCVADVYSQQGDYAKAILTYKAIPNWIDRPKVLSAIADNLRKMGRMDEAHNAYIELINLERQGLPEFRGSADRARAGIAEIAKRQGRLDDALGTYRSILEQRDIDDRDRLIHRLALCNILKLKEEFDEAYQVVDAVIQEYPFAMQARFFRGSILGLMGREQDGLKDVPENIASRSWQEWLRRYYRGLLLLKLQRYEDARKNLVEELPKAIASGEEKSVLRMAASLWFLRSGETAEADGMLSGIPDLDDCHIQYLLLVLRLHCAAQKEDRATMNYLMKRIAGIQVVDARLEKAVVALHKKDFSLALACETDAFLKLAA